MPLLRFFMEDNMKSTLHGFIQTQETPVHELGGTMLRFVHEKTGLELAWLKRPEENKTFGIAFETLPEDDTGVFHILEHSTLCGSEKYPVKEPFVALMKNSMNTFLNAMTFPDKTIYPVSSKNNKDFMNLVSVYLDAVFAPAIYHKQEIFLQEGWHYEFDEDGSAYCNGVVFNEMKGVYSDPDELADTALMQALFPDTPYHYAYGGDPEKIPDLTYEQFLETHKRFYSPSNAYVFLDGMVDLDAVLALLDEQYLSHMEKGTRIAPPPKQDAVKRPMVCTEYEVGSEEEEDGTARLLYGNVIGDCTEREKLVAMEILGDVLCGDNQSPLCKAVLESGLAEDVVFSVQGEIRQPYAKLELRNMSRENVEQAEKLVQKVLTDIADQGIDKEALDAAMANAKFRMQERDFGGEPQGVVLFQQVMDSWLYGGAPEDHLEVGEVFASLEEKAKHGYFEALVKEILLQNPHAATVLLLPSHTLGEKRAEAEMQRVDSRLASMSDEAVQALHAKQEALAAWQMSEDSPEVLATMPSLTLADVDVHPEQIPTEISEADGVQILHHPVNSNGIIYCSLYFDISDLTEQEISRAALLCDLLGKLDTIRYTSEKLAIAVRKIFGSLDFSIESFAGENETDACRTKLCVSYSTLQENAAEAMALAVHILRETRYDDITAIQNIIRQCRVELYQEIAMSGSQAALRRLSAACSVSGVVSECSNGIDYYQFLKELDAAEDFRFLQSMADDVFCRDDLTVSFTSDTAEPSLAALTKLPAGKHQRKPQSLKPWSTMKEGWIVPSDVAFAARGGSLLACGGRFSAEMALAAHIISLDYLWNTVRVQGGAYGTGLVVNDAGFCGGYSYRDPSADASLQAFAEAGAYLKDALTPDADLTGEIIGTIAEGSPLLTARMKGQRADALFFRSLTWDALCARREALLRATPATLCRAADLLDQTLRDHSGLCVIGSKEQLEQCGVEKMMAL